MAVGLTVNLHKKTVFIDIVIFQNFYSLGWYYAAIH